MKIALVTDTFRTGGGLEHLYQVARAMRGVSFAIFARGGEAAGRFSELENVRVFPEGYRAGELLRVRPDLIHFHHLRPLLDFCGRPFSRGNPFFRGRIPVVFTAHGLHVRKYGFLRGWSVGARRTCRSWLEKALYRRADAVVAVSREDMSFLREEYGLSRTVHIPNGVDPQAFRDPSFSRQVVRQALGLPVRSRIFLTVARFDLQKGYDVLVRAIGSGKEFFRKNEVLFVFVGEGRETGAIRKLAARVGGEGQIRFLGERQDVYAIMKASDLFILPSRWEGLPIALIEATMCGLPIVASKTCGNREFVQDTGAGFLFENENPADLVRVLSEILDNWRADRAPDSGPVPRALCGYDIADTCAKLNALYAGLISASRARQVPPC